MSKDELVCMIELETDNLKIKVSGSSKFVSNNFYKLLDRFELDKQNDEEPLLESSIDSSKKKSRTIHESESEWVKEISQELGMSLSGIETKLVEEKGVLVPKNWPDRDTKTLLYQEIARVILCVNKFAKNQETISNRTLYSAIRYIDPGAAKATLQDSLAAISEQIAPVKEHGKKRATQSRLVAKGIEAVKEDLKILMKEV